jgi:muramoyltetrapeptide carboxypeptidase
VPRRAAVYTRRLPTLRTPNLPKGSATAAIKPAPLVSGGLVRVISTASPADRDALGRGIAELERLGYQVRTSSTMQPEGYFAGSTLRRKAELEGALQDPDASAVICARGGYGTATLLDQIRLPGRIRPKLLIGYSDVTMLQAYLWTRFRWTSLHGPMVVAGFNNGAGARSGYDLASFVDASAGKLDSWSLALDAEPLSRGEASGLLLGGCISLLETTLGTPWEFDTRGAILFLEDRGVKPYQLDRMLLHLLQAGKFRGVRGIVLGDFPDSEPPQECSPSVRDVCRRILMPLRVPMIFGAPIGHTVRPMLTIPFGVRARLRAAGEGRLDILEPAVAVRK